MKTRFLMTIAAAALLSACGNEKPSGDTTAPAADSLRSGLSEQTLRYKADTTNCVSYAVYDKGRTGALPVVLVIPEWWGLGDYVKMRSRELAKLGYFALAVDMYGEGRQGADPKSAGALSTPFYTNDSLVGSRISAALSELRNFPQADPEKVAIMGYCFGGTMSLKAVQLGLPLAGAVSFHGGLQGTASAKAPVLVCHGEADSFVPADEVAAWKKAMDALHADYTFRSYPGATHAFTNPNATEKGKQFSMPISYNSAADSASWQEMQVFLKKVL